MFVKFKIMKKAIKRDDEHVLISLSGGDERIVKRFECRK